MNHSNSFSSETRSSSIESRPNRVVLINVVVSVFLVLECVFVVGLVVVLIVIIFGHRCPTIRLGQNWGCSCCCH